ncbi:peptidylprolyl isomerase [Naasia sp. SYSU D00948]|uniref:peptidylprolyl isomerase n=1 Tax=Naasia sp. SYSU D00948 TaxID=2817379 RepID=UPI0027DDC617|nr:peptidylprolyl isomerase [Naasia sp. SYSU D00948]
MARRGTRDEREARQRLRDYTARQTLHEERIRRRRRDNILASVAALVVIGLAVGAQLLYFTAGPGVATPTPTPSASPSATAPEGSNTGAVPDPALAEDRTWTGTLTLNDVPLGITLDGAAAAQGVAAFVSLTQSGFYPGKTCHRLTNGGFFVLQCGSANGDGTGDPGFAFGPIENAPADNVYPAGTIALARQSGNAYSNSSQFFLVYEDTTIPADEAGGYTVLGQVTSGLDQLKAAVTDAGTADGSPDGPPAVPTTITSVTVQ